MTKAKVQFQRRWRLADEKGSVAKAEQWAAEHGLEVEKQ